MPVAGTPAKSAGRLSTIEIIGLVLIIALYLSVAIAHAYLAPLTTGPDELAHYEYVHFIAEHGRFPLDKAERGQASYKSDQPPLYHLLAAIPAALVDPEGPPFLKRVQDHNRRQLIERTRHAWGLYNTEDEMWPYQGEVLRWHVGRWVAIFFGAATIIVTFLMARGLLAKLPPFTWAKSARYWPGLAALGAAAIVGFIPRFALTGSMLNYETTLAFFAALFLWVLLPMATHDKPESSEAAPRFLGRAVLLGLLAGLAMTAKLSALILPLEAGLLLWLIGRYYGWGWKMWARHATISLVVSLVTVSWWFGFVIYQFNTVMQDGLWTGLLRPLIAADSSDATTNRLLSFLTRGQAGFTGAIDNLDSGPPWEWLAIFFRTFWMVGIEQQQPLGSVGLVVAFGLILLAASGLIAVWRLVGWQREAEEAGLRRVAAEPNQMQDPDLRDVERWPTPPYTRLVLVILVLHCLVAFILPLIRYAATFSLADTAQGRHILFQTAPAVAILLVWGSALVVFQIALAGFGKSSKLRQLSYLFVLVPGSFLLIWSGVQLWTMTWAYNPALPVRTRSLPQAEPAHPVELPLNKFVTLLGYERNFDEANRMLRLDLQWLSTGISPVDYLTEVSLVDSHGDVQAEWVGYPAGGRYPTRAWDEGDIVRDSVWLPTAGLEPGEYDLRLNLGTTQLGLPPDQTPVTLETPLDVGPLTISDPTLRIFNNSFPFTGAAQASAGYSVWQQGQPLAGPVTFRYRETILVTLSPLLSGQERTVRLLGSDPDRGGEALDFAPVRENSTMALFIVGPDWPTGDYRLQVTLTPVNGEEQWVSTGTVAQVIDRWARDYTEPDLSRRVEANFANQIKLVGYDLNADRAEAGGGIPLTLYWQGLDWLGEDYTIFAKLMAADGTVHGSRDRLPREGYSTLYWAPGEYITDPFGVPVDLDTPDGVYFINLGLYREVDRQAVSLPLVQAGQLIDATSINIGPIKVGRAPPGVTVDAVEPQVTLNQPLGHGPDLTLLGFDLADQAGRGISDRSSSLRLDPDQSTELNLTLYWRSEALLPKDYTTFVHLRNATGETVAQKDQPPLDGAYPTSLWEPGEIIVDQLVVQLPTELTAGAYRFVVGMYDPQTGQRLSVPGSPADETGLTSVEIP
jgi:hypothetical protein